MQIYSTSTPVNIMTEGTHTLKYSSIDFFGNQEATNTLTVKIDKTPPAMSVTTTTSTYILNAQPVSFGYAATDTASGLASTTATLDGRQIGTSTTLGFITVGPHTIVISASDVAGNFTSTAIHYAVAYKFGGFLAPIKADGSGLYKLGQTLPVKFQLTDANG